MKRNLPDCFKSGLISTACLLSAVPAVAGWEQIKSLPNTYAHFVTSEGVHLVSDFREDRNGGISYSEDGGETWVKTDVKDYWYSDFYEADGYVFALGASCRIGRSEDGGRTWDVLNYSKAVEDYIDEAAVSSTVCYALTVLDGVLYAGDFSGGGVLKSDDYGETWEQTDRDSQIIVLDDGTPIIENYYNLTAFDGKVYSFGVYSVHSYDPATGLWKTEPMRSNFMGAVTLVGDMMVCGRSVENYGTDVDYLVTYDGDSWGHCRVLTRNPTMSGPYSMMETSLSQHTTEAPSITQMIWVSIGASRRVFRSSVSL